MSRAGSLGHETRGANALLERVPALRARLPIVPLGTWPTPLEPTQLRGQRVWMKREDLSDPTPGGYAGNKIRPLEVVFGAARAAGKQEIWATGAYGSNHALATVVHARRQGLVGGAVLWPQPWSRTAADNLVATASLADHLRFVPSVVAMPLAAVAIGLSRSAWVMPPGAATPLGAAGHAAAAIELMTQLQKRKERPPDTIVLPTGSTCTAVGLLVGTALAAELGLVDHARLPRIIAVRVTPWPVTDRLRMARMATATAAFMTRLGGPYLRASRLRDFLARLTVTGEALGPGYGHPTPAGWAAIADLWHHGIRLDTTYSAKAAGWLLAHLGDSKRGLGPEHTVVFWLTKSAPPLPPTDVGRVASLPVDIRRWLDGVHRPS